MRGRDWIAVGAIVWCCAFAALHVFWALGGSAGLASSAGAELAARRPTAFVVLGLWGVAALLLAAAVVVGVAVNAQLPTRLGRILGWLIGAGGLVMLARGVMVEILLITDAGGVRTAVGPEQTHWSLVLWNPWFVVGGLAFIWSGRSVMRRWPSVRSARLVKPSSQGRSNLS
ncbi:DUF3995 domain-containing protein [Rhodococcus hoagii]|nr:DUF3995 domain-containing protein [Prescottella equi]NKS72229.1 DUF3995 domain-containing protein [Prescottella equi]